MNDINDYKAFRMMKVKGYFEYEAIETIYTKQVEFFYYFVTCFYPTDIMTEIKPVYFHVMLTFFLLFFLFENIPEFERNSYKVYL